ncbi:3'-5' exonuclease [Sorangium sp. So ce233]|uniref:3'-5' exonuclease n=1 Tax=Sorangium sp. So ce233 TaxID=3133290 RepID=UPI003F6280E3
MSTEAGKDHIVAVARDVVPDLEAAPGAEEGKVAKASEAELRREARAGDFVLSRANAPLVRLCLAFLAEGRPATIIGRDIGSKLATLVRKSEATTVPELRRWIDDWARSQEERLKRKGKDASAVRDEAECLHRLVGGSTSVSAVLARIERLFSDHSDGARIVLATTHKAKGLERERVWVLKDTYKRNSVEEDNLWYVAVTRAKRDLRLVRSAA